MLLTRAQQLAMFMEPDAPQRVLEYVKEGNIFCDDAELKMFDLPNAEEILREYIKICVLSDESEIKMLDLLNAEELMEMYGQDFLGKEALAKWKQMQKNGVK